MIAPHYGEPCVCEACTVAGMRGQRLIATAPGVWAHGRELARLYRAIAAYQEQAKRLPRRTMPAAVVQTDPSGRPL